MEEIIEKIFPYIRTKDEKERMISSLEKLEGSLYRSFPTEFHEILRSQFPTATGTIIREFFDTPSHMRNPTLIQRTIERMKQAVAGMRVLRLELAFDPNELMVERLNAWILQNVGAHLVIDVGYDPSVVGGARIIFGGKYKEKILAEMIKDVFHKKRDLLMRELT